MGIRKMYWIIDAREKVGNLSKCHICNNFFFERRDEITCNIEE